MSAERVVANLLRIAREDLEGARALSAQGNRNAIYLAEQAAEKIIRAVLTSEKIPLKPRLRVLQHLGAYATAYRYTTPTGRIPTEPSAAQVSAAIASVDVALTEAVGRFGVDLAATDQPARTSAPIR